MLAQFGLIVFAMFAMLSLVVDFGFVTLSRVQMQNAADAAALEGIRFRNSVNADGFASDCTRRIAARDIVQRTFADFDITAGDSGQMGAGPILDFDGGDADTGATQFMSAPGVHVYKPVLELNQSVNAVNGDLVSGTFGYTTAPGEDSSYVRTDFVPNPSTPSPSTGLAGCEPVPDPWPEPPTSGPLTSAADSAFLVRLRRTKDFNPDGGPENAPGVASSGPSVPLLFGRGAAISGEDGYVPQRDGITVRATAIAQARPAMRVGLAGRGPGVTPFALERLFAESLNLTPRTVTVDAGTGVISEGGIERGAFVADPLSITTAGGAVVPAPFACDPANDTIDGYAPIYATIGASNRVIGFVRIELSWPGCAGNPTLIRGMGLVAGSADWSNATALLRDGLPADVPIADRPAILAANRSLSPDIVLLAPVLAR
jgi:Putative Flp pilus-assembly TadE/G-like